MSYQPDMQLIDAYSKAENALDAAVRAMVIDECKHLVPEFNERLDDAAHVLREASAAVSPGEKALADLASEIDMLSTELASFAEQAQSGDIKARVAAKLCVRECESDIAALTDKQRAMETELSSSRNTLKIAQQNLRDAQEGLDNLELVVSNPAFAYMGEGKRTVSYSTFRWGLALRAAFEGNHPEREAAEEHVSWLLERSGFRPDLPKDADMYRRHWDSIFDQANPSQDEPSGAEVVAGIHRQYESIALAKIGENTVQHVEDLRGVKLPKRNDTVREELRWSR